jgi:hypothetical protein
MGDFLFDLLKKIMVFLYEYLIPKEKNFAYCIHYEREK